MKRYAEDWLKRRTTHTVQDDEGRLKLHALPALKDLTLQEVRPRHIRELVRSLSQKASDAENGSQCLRRAPHDVP